MRVTSAGSPAGPTSAPMLTGATSKPSSFMVGTSGTARNPAVPEVPTMKEEGFDVAPVSIGALVGPAGLPADVTRILGEACRNAARGDAYVRLAKSTFQPDDYYGDGATLAREL